MAYRDYDSSMWAQAMQAHGDYMLNALLQDARALRCINDPFRVEGKFVTPLVFSIEKELSLQRIERLLKEAHAHVDDRCMNLASEQGWHALVDLLLQHGGMHTDYTWRELFDQSTHEEAMEMCLRYPELATIVARSDEHVARVQSNALGRQEAARRGAMALVHSVRVRCPHMPKDIVRLIGEKVIEPQSRVDEAWYAVSMMRIPTVKPYNALVVMGYFLLIVSFLWAGRHNWAKTLPAHGAGFVGPKGLRVSADTKDYITVENTGVLSIMGLETKTDTPSLDFNFSCPFAISAPPGQPT